LGIRFSPDPVPFVLPQLSRPRICFYFTEKNLYAGSNNIKFIGQALC
jgi:hypothetical protein